MNFYSVFDSNCRISPIIIWSILRYEIKYRIETMTVALIVKEEA